MKFPRLTRPANLIEAWDRIASEIESLVRRAAQRRNVSRSVNATSDLSLSDDIILVDASGGARTINLPPAAASALRTFTIKKIDASANAVTIEPAGAETIDGATNKAITVQWASLTINSNGTAWFIL